MTDGHVEGDVRGLRKMLADCEQYLKEGETPAQRIEREWRDTEDVLTLLVREKQKTELLSAAMQDIDGLANARAHLSLLGAQEHMDTVNKALDAIEALGAKR